MNTGTTNDSQITHVSDTALWVAVYRAIESKRKDALFHDAYAETLAGERGKQIVENMRHGKTGAWSMIVRTAVMDEFIHRVIKEDNVDTVVNLAAGLDARPYRMDLPSSIKWIEVDFSDMISYKEERLSDAKPRCSLERVKLDLIDSDARKRLFDRINAESRRVMVITEGLFVYLREEEVTALAADLHGQANFRWWIMDILSPVMLDWMKRSSFKHFTEGAARMLFAPEEAAGFFGPYGWTAYEVRSVVKEAWRLKREPALGWLFRFFKPLIPKNRREIISNMDSYLVMLKRNATLV